MTRRFAEHLVAGLGVRFDANLIGHGARRHKQGSLLAEHGGDAVLEAVDGWVVVEDIVADLGGVHGSAHAGRGTGDSVAAEVDNGVGGHRGPFLETNVTIHGTRRTRPWHSSFRGWGLETSVTIHGTRPWHLSFRETPARQGRNQGRRVQSTAQGQLAGG